MAEREHIKKHRQEVKTSRERIALFKAVWAPTQRREKEKQSANIASTFICSADHVLCKPLQPIMCTCERRPAVEAETVDLYSYPADVDLVIDPALDRNQPYLDLLLHSPFHRTLTNVCHPLTVTFADVAAAAGNIDLLRHLFTSSESCVRNFFAAYYSYQDPGALLKLFVHALNSGSHEVVMYLVEKFFEELTSDVKVAILEASLWLATTKKSLELCFRQLALKFGVNIVNSGDRYCPLRLTCMYDNGDAAAFLVDHGADMYVENANGCTVAYHAYKYGTYTFGVHRVLKTLLAKGLGVEAVMVQGSHFRYPLMYTFLNHSQLDLVRHLVDCGHDVNLPIRICVDDQERCVSPLMHALTCQSVECATWLMEQGADVNQRSFVSQRLDDESWTPLHMAATLGNLTVVRKLIQHGARMDAITATGETILALAVEKAGSCSQAIEVVSYLVQMNAPIRSIPGLSFLVKSRQEDAVRSEWSMLELAVYIADLAIVQVLLQSGHFPHQLPKVADFLPRIMRPESSSQRRAMKLVEDFVTLNRVPSLQILCRDTLRAACGLRLLPYANTTVMPARLRSFLLLEDVLGALDRQVDEEEEEVSAS